jgi:hypothetical protein
MLNEERIANRMKNLIESGFFGKDKLLLNEAFADKYPKNKFVELGIDDIIEYENEIFTLISNAYKDKGGNLEIKDISDINKSDVKYWIVNDIDIDPDIDIVLGGKSTKNGIKMTMMGQDGSKESKKESILKLIDLMKTKGFYAEMDLDLANKLGLNYISDENVIRNIINKKLTMNSDGSYDREIAGELHTKVLVGIPNE